MNIKLATETRTLNPIASEAAINRVNDRGAAVGSDSVSRERWVFLFTENKSSASFSFSHRDPINRWGS